MTAHERQIAGHRPGDRDHRGDHNDPAVVAAAFSRQIARSGGWFDRIVFPVYDRHAGTPTYTAFTRVLA